MAKITKRIERTYNCSVCNAEYTTSRHSVKRYCSDRCRKTASRHKTAFKRIEKLPVSEEWLYIARECKRAGTVEILHFHTVESLESLFALRNYKYKCYGWDSEKKTSKFDLCHIQPVSGKSTVGLLHPLNLFVGSSLPNKVHGTKSHPGVGLSIRRFDLQAKWLVSKEDSDKKVLDKVQRYLGPVLKEYAANNPIRTSQRFGLAKWIFNNDSEHRFTLAELERKSMMDLRKLRAQIEEREVYKVDLIAKRALLVYFDELTRFSDVLPEGNHKNDCAFLIDVLRVAITTLAVSYGEEGFHSVVDTPAAVSVWTPAVIKDYTEQRFSDFRDWLSFTAFETLQGCPLERGKVLNTLRSYIQVEELIPTYRDYHKATNVTFLRSGEFGKVVEEFHNAVLKLGLLNAVQEFELLDLCKAANSEVNATVDWLSNFDSCANIYDYSTIYYEVEGDYITDPLGDEAYTYLNYVPTPHEAIERISHSF